MENQEFNEKDWKLFKAKLPEWQEAYIDKLNRKYVELLSTEGLASEKFWTLKLLKRKSTRIKKALESLLK